MGAAIPAVGMRKTGKPGHKKETRNVRWKTHGREKLSTANFHSGLTLTLSFVKSKLFLRKMGSDGT